MAGQKPIVLNGANVAHAEPSKRRKPRVANLVVGRHALEDDGSGPIIIVDASMWHSDNAG